MRKGDLSASPLMWSAPLRLARGPELIAIGNDRPEDGDGEMVQDFWTD